VLSNSKNSITGTISISNHQSGKPDDKHRPAAYLLTTTINNSGEESRGVLLRDSAVRAQGSKGDVARICLVSWQDGEVSVDKDVENGLDKLDLGTNRLVDKKKVKAKSVFCLLCTLSTSEISENTYAVST